MRRHVVVVAGAVLLATGCAQPAPPPGGEPDRTPPEPVQISPEPMSVVDPWDGDVVIRFNERLSEQGTENALLVSPETGRPNLGRGGWGSELKVSIDGGWRADRVYRVVLRPGLRDRFRNERETPIEVVFSTGPSIPTSALAGVVTDRLTGEPLRDARVEARPMDDSVSHVTLSDSLGGFVLPYVPAGEYRVRAYQDGNMTRTLEPFEPRDSSSAAIAEDGDTTRVRLAVLMPDSTPAQVVRAEPIDSLRVRLVFDDAFDPEDPLGEPEARVYRLADSTDVAVEEIVHAQTFERREAERAAADSAAAADSVRVDSLAVDSAALERPPDADSLAVDSLAMEAAETEAADADSLATDSLAVDSLGPNAAPTDTAGPAVLPSQEVVIIVERPFEPGVDYIVEVTGLTNISGVPDGGGMGRFVAPEPPPPPAEDTTAAPADTTAAPGDSTDVAPYTTAAPSDGTAGAQPDTTAADPDTTATDPDTTVTDSGATDGDPAATATAPDTTVVYLHPRRPGEPR